MKKVFCPVCWHEETWRAIRQHGEPVRDDVSVMLWHRPEGGARGQPEQLAMAQEILESLAFAKELAEENSGTSIFDTEGCALPER